VAEAQQVHEQLQQEVQLRQRLVEQLPAVTKSQIDPRLLKINPVALAPHLSMEMKHTAIH